MRLIDRIQAKIELFRLEQRYTRRRHRRSTFVSNAIYVDGEYIYQSPNTTGSSAATSKTSSSIATTRVVEFDSSHYSSSAAAPTTASATKQKKRLNRWSSMPGYGPGSSPDASMGRIGGMPTVREQEWRGGRVSFDERRRY
ncbi:hypothetical protein MYCTH_2316107 [Thermothelomyces thermophilus ATCC 42464]|uniref:Uncharacterized protein n=1 Tax=Thermothelomyces thermophilus (strain ATCC 42464 / BCRC 31852 / DSM 1799) TaxID=573729 RepID=G2QIZ9_THET4|nr:uncharacterized protein MYCTH_2316107 [Thermothelomyces thermophilus ATCC 42464]AEO60418.1 hypothetical protein MYCTH_2316107 [Thermothelomyces thermophilus ATCC 42464]